VIQEREGDATSIAVTLGLSGSVEDNEKAIYRGQLNLLPPSAASIALCEHARQMIEAAFAPYDPLTAQNELDLDDFVERVAPLKPRFIHDPQTRALQKAYLEELGFDPDRTYLDVPRMRVATSDGYLTSGVGHKQPPHRDTWWSAPMQQIQFWLPIFPMARESSVVFYPHYVETGVENTSGDFNIYRWNATGRRNAAKHRRGDDDRGIPQPLGPLEHPEGVQVVLPVGGAVIFSANQLHATSDNSTGKTRFSIDFRIVDGEHVREGLGALDVDNESTGTALRDFRRVSDETELDPAVIEKYDIGSKPGDGVLVFSSDIAKSNLGEAVSPPPG